MHERIEVDLMLLSAQSPQDNDLQITFDVTASAVVREHGATLSEPGELLVEDIEIVNVRSWSLRYGRCGSAWPEDTACKAAVAIENQRRLDWLNSQLDDRDDWTDWIMTAVLAKHDTALAVY